MATPYDQPLSSVTWGTRYTSPTDTGPATQNAADWDAARAAYVDALTKPTAAEREAALADTFLKLGQLLHLLQDLAVPAHVRDDFQSHLDWEIDLSRPAREWVGNAFERYVRDRLPPMGTADPSRVGFTDRPVPRFWDTGQYRQAVTPSTDYAQGLAEYTSANFLSKYALFPEDQPPEQRVVFPHPTRASTNADDIRQGRAAGLRQCLARDGVRETGWYLSRTGEVGEAVPYLVRAAYLYRNLQETSPPPPDLGLAYQFDECVHASYAALLLPRAVTYSAALLDYFFRGKLDVRRVPHPETGQPSLRIVNRSGEPVGPGTLAVFAESDQGVRTKVVALELGEAVSPDNEGSPLLLPLATAAANRLILVFAGRLGAEPTARLGQVVPQVAAEQVYRDEARNRWVLRTADGQYLLPLEEAANLAGPPVSLIWGARDNQLVAVTAPGAGASSEALLFEIQRPQREATVPLQGAPGGAGLPVVALQLVIRRAVTPALEGLELGVQLAYTATVALAQAFVSGTETYWCDFRAAADPAGYVCALERQASLSGPAALGTHQIQFAEPLRLDRAHQRRGGEAPLHYQWELEGVDADPEGRLIARVRLQTTAVSAAEGEREAPTLQCDPAAGGTTTQTGPPMRFGRTRIEPRAELLAVIDLTGGTLLGVTSAADIAIETDERLVLGEAAYGCFSSTTHYAGGRADGASTPGPPGLSVAYEPPLDEVPPVTLRLVDIGHRVVRRWDGVFRASLAEQGLGLVAPPMPGFLFPAMGPIGGTPTGSVRLEVPGQILPLELLPADRIVWARWDGPAPGRLRLLTNRVEFMENRVRTVLAEWEVSRDRAGHLEWTDPGWSWEPVTATAQGTLLQGRAGSETPTLIWATPAGSVTELPTVGGLAAYVGLEPDYLYHVYDGRFHTIAPGFPAESEPAPLVPGPDAVGSYHVVGR